MERPPTRGERRQGTLTPQQFLQRLFEHSPDAVFLIDPQQDAILAANRAASRLLGYTLEELLSLPISAIHPHEMPKLRAFAQSIYGQGEGWTNELSCRTKNGQMLAAEMAATVVRLSGKLCIIALVREASRRVRATASVEQARLEGATLAARTPAREIDDQLGLVVSEMQRVASDPALPDHLKARFHQSLGAAEGARLAVSRLERVLRLDEAESPAPDPSPVDLLQDLTGADMAELERAAKLVRYESGGLIFLPGETGEALYVVQTGQVALYRLSPEGRKLVLATLGPGNIFGEMAALGQGMRDAFAEAVERSTLCMISREDVERLLIGKPRMALRLLAQVGKRLQDAGTQMEELAFRALPERLAALLLRLAERAGTPHEVAGQSHQELADMLGVYRESVSKALIMLKAEGVLITERRRIRLLKIERLRALAQAH